MSGTRRIRRRPYAAASLEHEGFIHCTDGVEALGATFERYFLADPRPFVALTVDLDALDVAVALRRGGLAVPAHLRARSRAGRSSRVSAVERAPDGRFEGLGAGRD